MLKKSVCLLMCGFAVWMGSSPRAEASNRGFAFGLNAGIGPTIWSFGACRFGLEAGYRFSTRFGALVEAETGTTTYESSTGWSMSYQSSSKMTYTSTPVTLSLHYIAPVNDRTAVYIGLGGGYYWLTLESSDIDLFASGQTTQSTRKVQAFAPHVCLGLECAVMGRIVLIGEVRQSVGKARLSTTDAFGFISEEDFPFGGTQAKIGLRIFIGRPPDDKKPR